jgi:hypothetical protein
MTNYVNYSFKPTTGKIINVDLTFDDEHYRMKIGRGASRPKWARLNHHKCSNCPLKPDVKWCPAAVAMAQFIPKFSHFLSHDEVSVEVEMPGRTISTKTTFQMGLASLVGLVLATSGCPRTEFLRPMARFHLPFASEQETVFRSLATHLLGIYVENQLHGKKQAINFDRLKNDYAEIATVNGQLTERLRDAVERDAALNAVIVLDTLAMITPENPDGTFDDIEGVFNTEQ